jgi:hypothetical protein
MIRSPIFLGVLLGILAFTFVPIKHIDPSLNPLFNKIFFTMVEECDRIKLPNQFILEPDDIRDKGWVGVATISAHRLMIRIDKEYMKKSTQEQLEVTLMHEMAHGLLGLDHIDNPNHYMYYMESDVRLIDALNQFKQDVRRRCNEL